MTPGGCCIPLHGESARLMVLLRYLKSNWERVLFALLGITCLAQGIHFLFTDNIPAASATFAIGFFSFLYSNLARFKRFKGLGFEAELWEDKQKEAAELIERLKGVIAIFSRETMIGQVAGGRSVNGPDWPRHWALYNELVAEHGALGQAIDLSETKAQLDTYFLFDMCQREGSVLKGAYQKARLAAEKTIDAEFGSPIRDAAGYSARHAALRTIEFNIKDLRARMARCNVAEELIEAAGKAAEEFRREFGLEMEIDTEAVTKLNKIAQWWGSRPLTITPEMMSMADRPDKN